MKIIVLLAMLLSAPTVVTTMAAPSEHAGQDMPVVIGMLEELDASKMSGKIKTDLARIIHDGSSRNR